MRFQIRLLKQRSLPAFKYFLLLQAPTKEDKQIRTLATDCILSIISYRYPRSPPLVLHTNTVGNSLSSIIDYSVIISLGAAGGGASTKMASGGASATTKSLSRRIVIGVWSLDNHLD
jgi:hypothetical protein